jgi:tetratricopeptide (TPR) repeat protein
MTSRVDRRKIANAAEKYVKAGKLREAIAEYERLLDGSAQVISISNIIGDLFVQLGQEDNALKIFRTNAQNLEKRGAYSQALAISKKIQKLDPTNIGLTVKLGDLYNHLGFLSEARSEYAKAAEELEAKSDLTALISLYEKLTRLDHAEIEPRLKLAGMYVKKGAVDKALAELNDVADLLFVRNDLKRAEKVLADARRLKDGDVRTVANLVRIYIKERRKKEAVALVEQSFQKHKSDPDLLKLIGNFYLDIRDDAKAMEIFAQILANEPQNADARAKLAAIEIRRGKLDRAFKLYEPLLTNLINKKKEDKAIGLLGLILMTGAMHLPSLEKLASIYRYSSQGENLEIVDRILLEEYKKKKMEEKRLRVLQELVSLCPDDPKLGKEILSAGIIDQTAAPAPGSGTDWTIFLSPEDRDIIKTNLAKADLYLQRGLARNARRILKNLELCYPQEPSIGQHLALIRKSQSSVEDEEIPLMVEQVSAKEAELGEKKTFPKPGPDFPRETLFPQDEGGEKISAEEIFAGTELVPLARPQEESRTYLDLEGKIGEELEAIEATFYKQLKDKTDLIEKDLADIVLEFRRHVEEKIDLRDSEARYNLGVAFFEQGLMDEAIEEFKIAAQDESRAADCFALVSRCYEKKKNLREALKWLGEAMKLTTEGTDPYYSLTYDLATLYEALNENAAALAFFRQVRAWNAKYRDVAKRIKILEKISS